MNEQAHNGDSVAERLARVEQRMARACEQASRRREDVNLLAVSKGHPPERVREAVEAGVRELGESKVQEARVKQEALSGALHWHLIGHLQTNKIKWAVQLFETVHSVDSLKLLTALNEGAAAAGKVVRVFLEVNVSGEASKFGLVPEAVPAVLEAARTCMALDVVGLMTMPPFTEDPEKARPHFAELRARRDRWRAETGTPLDELSMGMSHDLEVAIGEGSTWVRVGTDIFGGR